MSAAMEWYVCDEGAPHDVPDFTPNTDDYGIYCAAGNERGYGLCSRMNGHTGRHAAGDTYNIIAVWR